MDINVNVTVVLPENLSRLIDMQLAKDTNAADDAARTKLQAQRDAAGAEKKERKPRAAKTEKTLGEMKDDAAASLDAITAPATPAPAAPELSEAESKKKAEDTARAFVMRFQNAKPTGVERAKAILKEKFKVERMGDLVHPQRVEFIKTLESELAAAN